jgi:hypothetical protein
LAVFDLGALAGERDVIPETIFDGIGVLDWPALCPVGGSTATTAAPSCLPL